LEVVTSHFTFFLISQWQTPDFYGVPVDNGAPWVACVTIANNVYKHGRRRRR